MTDDPRAQLTQMLNAAGDDPRAAGRILGLVQEELRRIARKRMKTERPDHTLGATALVNEMYLRLVDNGGQWQDRAHFFRTAATVMRNVLVDYARSRGRKKRDPGRRRTDDPAAANVAELAARGDPDEILDLHEALARLEAEDAEAGEIVRLRFFGGLTIEETAEAIGTSPETVKRRWMTARVRLKRAMGAAGPG